MTPEELRKLANEASPGQWKAEASDYAKDYDMWSVEGPTATGYDAEVTQADARLIALAPDLARLCAELGEALEYALMAEDTGDPDFLARWIGISHAALAKLSELGPR